jgi:hypothetical protein
MEAVLRPPLTQPPGANPGGLPHREVRKLFVFNAISRRREILNGNCSRFCVGESLRLQQLSTLSSFLLLNPKEFREECRVDLLVPNQIPTLIEFC